MRCCVIQTNESSDKSYKLSLLWEVYGTEATAMPLPQWFSNDADAGQLSRDAFKYLRRKRRSFGQLFIRMNDEMPVSGFYYPMFGSLPDIVTV